MDLGLTGKNVLLFGGNSNIGRATSLLFAQEGANILIAARDLDAAQRIVDEAQQLNKGRAMALHCDATKWEDVQRVVDRAQELGPIDVCYHGVAWDLLGTFLEIDPADWDRIIDVNFRSVLIAYRIILPIMKEQRRGCFITVSSVMGRKPTPIEPLYGACKAGLIYLNHTLALELGEYGVRLNVVAPGPTPPPGPKFVSKGSCFNDFMSDPAKFATIGEQFKSTIPLRKMGDPFDSACAVLFLASEVTGGHQTGQVLGVDGGWYMPN